MTSALRIFGFCQLSIDHSLFTSTFGSTFAIVLMYVDDIIVAGNDDTSIRRLKSYLHTRFHIKDLGPLKYFLGIEVAQSPEDIFLNQQKFTLDILTESSLLGSCPVHFSYGVGTQPPIRQNYSSCRPFLI